MPKIVVVSSRGHIEYNNLSIFIIETALKAKNSYDKNVT